MLTVFTTRSVTVWSITRARAFWKKESNNVIQFSFPFVRYSRYVLMRLNLTPEQTPTKPGFCGFLGVYFGSAFWTKMRLLGVHIGFTRGLLLVLLGLTIPIIYLFIIMPVKTVLAYSYTCSVFFQGHTSERGFILSVHFAVTQGLLRIYSGSMQVNSE